MITIHLMVEEDYIEEMMNMLPKDKVVVIEENFKENCTLLSEVKENYHNSSEDFLSYYESMKSIDIWLEEKK